MGVGGAARYFVDACDEAVIAEALAWAQTRGLGARILGGGSNVLIADAGVDGLVIRVGLRGIETREEAGAMMLTAAAGEPWDDLVRHAVERGWAGIECLSGIPGLVGATPIQNVGAYGQEVSDTVTGVRALDRGHRPRRDPTGARACRLGYRDSALKSAEPERYIVLAVTYRLRPGGVPAVRYADIERELAWRAAWGDNPGSATCARASSRVRRSKSMVLDAGEARTRGAAGRSSSTRSSRPRRRRRWRSAPGARTPRCPAGRSATGT